MSYGATLDRAKLEAFKAQWPCHGLPDNLWRITFSFEANGDLCEIDARARNGRWIDSTNFDGPALVALSENAQRMVHPEHADMRFGKRT